MNERMKILQLLQSGKITAEQADELLAALEARDQRPQRSFRPTDKWNLGELKNLGSQITSAVTQSLGEVRKVLEQQVDQWSTQWSGHTITASHEVTVPEGVLAVSAETTNGRIQVSSWDEPTVRIHVRGQVKTTRMSEAIQALQNAVQTQHDNERFDLTVIYGKRDSQTGAQVVGAHIDIYVPHHMKQLLIRSQNGSLLVDAVQLKELHADTMNGAVTVHDSSVERLFVNTENGKIELHNSLTEQCRQVYAYTKNGTVTVEGISESVRATGTARTSSGRIDISTSDFEVESDEPHRPTFVRFRRHADSEQQDEVRLQLETKNGSIRVTP
jgi:DUF4097 and DUF4098 domain-containing protein YvlB